MIKNLLLNIIKQNKKIIILMDENYILNDEKGQNERKIGRKEKKELERKKQLKEKKKEKEIQKKKEEIKKKEKEKLKEEKREQTNKEDKNEKSKIQKLFSKNLKTKKKKKKSYEEENSKINILKETKDGLGLINNSDKQYKTKSQNLKLNVGKNSNQIENFENNIIKAYEKLSSFYKSDKNKKNGYDYSPQIIACLKSSEKKLRTALDILKKDKNIKINRNILDKLSRITEHDKINLNYVIGNIYMILMKRGSIFNYKSPDFEINDLVYFTNKVIQFKDILVYTRIGIFYKKCLIKYLNYVINEFDLEEDQNKIINQVLDDNKELEHKLKLQRDFDDVVYSISECLIKQNNFYEQYNILIQNKKLIIDNIKKANIKSKENYNRYLELGRILSYLFFNKSFRVYFSEQNDNDNNEEIYEKNEIFGFTKYFFDGKENNGEISFINSENYLIDYDGEIEELREKICDIIIEYANKFINLKKDFTIQYIVYILIKRIFFSNYKKYQNISKNLLVKILCNLCFFEESIDLVDYFINKILKSKEEDQQSFKKLLIKQLKKIKDDSGCLYNFPISFESEDKLTQIIEEEKLDIEDETKEDEKKGKEIDIKKPKEEEEEEDIEENEKEEEENEEEENGNEGIQKYYKINSEILFLLEKDLKIGFFNIQNIKQGEKFIFYEEIKYSYGILDFCMYIKELDLNITIYDLTEGTIILKEKGIDQLIHCPFKLIMFFTNPTILKFEIDNSFSWFTSKTIKYKTNIFYPGNPYSIGHHILLNNYKNNILNREKRNKKKIKEEKKELNNNIENLLIMKIDEENKVFNCQNVKNNLTEIKQMIKNKEINIFTIFLEIKKNENENENLSNFYYNDEEKGFVKNKLEKETFEQYILNLVTKSKISDVNIINLFVINGDLEQNDIIYNKHSIKKILGFEPIIKLEGAIQKILFFIQNLNQAQIMYYLYKQKNKKEILDNYLLINYTKACGYQTILFINGEIICNPNEFKEINKNKSIEEISDILIGGIKSINIDKKYLNILLVQSVDEKENVITPENFEKILGEKIEDKINVKVEKLGFDFIKEIEINSHIFCLDN